MAAATRLANLNRLLNDRFNGKLADLARALERDDAYIWQLLRGNRNIGERTARHIEARLGLVRGALDQTSMIAADSLTEDEREMLERYRRASPSWKLALRYLGALKGDVQDDVSQSVNVLLSKVSADHAADERVAAAYGRPGQALHQPKPPIYGKKHP